MRTVGAWSARARPPALREGGIGDLPAVAAMARTAFDPEYRETWSEAQMAAVLAAAGGFLLVAPGDPGDGVLSFALCRQVLDEVELLLCATNPAARRAGIGAATLDSVICTAKARGATRLFLEVRHSNMAARALYAAAGLVQQGLRKSYYKTVTGGTVDAITLGLALKAE